MGELSTTYLTPYFTSWESSTSIRYSCDCKVVHLDSRHRSGYRRSRSANLPLYRAHPTHLSDGASRGEDEIRDPDVLDLCSKRCPHHGSGVQDRRHLQRRERRSAALFRTCARYRWESLRGRLVWRWLDFQTRPGR